MPEYIEREALIRAMRNMPIPKRAINKDWFVAVIAGVSAEIRLVTDFPIADVVERKRGEWEHISETMRCCCSQCKYERNVATQFGWNFCPNCGADMREVP